MSTTAGVAGAAPRTLRDRLRAGHDGVPALIAGGDLGEAGHPPDSSRPLDSSVCADLRLVGADEIWIGPAGRTTAGSAQAVLRSMHTAASPRFLAGGGTGSDASTEQLTGLTASVEDLLRASAPAGALLMPRDHGRRRQVLICASVLVFDGARAVLGGGPPDGAVEACRSCRTDEHGGRSSPAGPARCSPRRAPARGRRRRRSCSRGRVAATAPLVP